MKGSSNYGWPSRAAYSEKKSFILQTDKFANGAIEPTRDQLELVTSTLETRYLSFLLDNEWLEGVEALRPLVCRMMSLVKREAGPGFPWSTLCKSNGELFDRYSDVIVEAVISRIHNLSTCRDLDDFTRSELIKKNLMDPVRVFVKNEPHKKAKLEEGRVRLIHSCSIIDKLIEMCLVYNLCKKEIKGWRQIPSKPGIGFTDSMNIDVYEDIIRRGNAAASDVTGWDMSVRRWMLEWDAEFITLKCANRTDLWARVLFNKRICEARSVWCFSDGILVQTIFEGLQLSGKFNTSMGNSRMRVALATLIGSEWAVAMGDDDVEAFVEGAKEKYAMYGFPLKDYVRIRDSFEFCSHVYTKDGAYAVNTEKMLMNMLHIQGDYQTVYKAYDQFSFEMRGSPSWDLVQDDLEKVGFHNYLDSLFSDSGLVAWPEQDGAQNGEEQKCRGGV